MCCFNIWIRRSLLTLAGVLALLTGPARVADADHHKVTVLGATVCTNDPAVQHVTVLMEDFDEHFWEDCTEFQFFDASATQVDAFLVPNDVTSGENVVVHIGTAEWAATSGTPLDVVLPSNTIMDPAGQVCYHGVGANTHPLPNDFSCKDLHLCVDVTPVTCQTASTCGNGVVESGEQCDDGGTQAGDCCSPTCQFEPATTTCRPAAGACDAAEFCDGASATCPADALAPAATECRGAAGSCDLAEVCDGSNATCPADALAPAATECRGAAGSCDLAEICDGSNAACPADLKSTAECRGSVGACDLAELCDGLSNDCPADQFDPQLCDDGSYCNGDETCNQGVCEPGSPPSCSGSTPFCDEAILNCSECLADIDCSDGGFCNGPEICSEGTCGPGTAPTCSGSTLLCDDTLASCVECLNDTDCPEGFLCGAGVCQPPPNVPAMSPQRLAWLALGLYAVAFAVLRSRSHSGEGL